MLNKIDLRAVAFVTSSFCTFGGCVEVGQAAGGAVIVRDSKDPKRRTSLQFSSHEWAAFVAGVKAGEFDPS